MTAADYGIALATRDDIPGILELQEQNLPDRGGALSVALSHDWFEKALVDMPILVARRDGAYVYGPVCVARNERGRGLAGLFAELRAQLAGREGVLFIRRDNAASLKAHVRMGMREVAESPTAIPSMRYWPTRLERQGKSAGSRLRPAPRSANPLARMPRPQAGENWRYTYINAGKASPASPPALAAAVSSAVTPNALWPLNFPRARRATPRRELVARRRQAPTNDTNRSLGTPCPGAEEL